MKTNHVTQVAAFDKVLGFCNDQKAVYNPSNASIKLTALSALLVQAQKQSEAVKVAQAAYDTAVIARWQAFDPLPKLATRVINTLASTKASREIVQKANPLRQQLTGISNRPAVAGPEANGQASSSAGNQSPPKKRSTLKLAYDQKTDALAAMVQILSVEPLYVPNEDALKVASLKALVETLKAKTAAVNQTKEALKYARDQRRKLLYGEDGIYGTARNVKDYCKGLFGPQSDVYQHISSISIGKR